ncbi:transcriptional regulator [Methanobrevibacter sp.]|uniref:transcriptional regulator n=1 Tax=Methanobrevibacter sp. TaxID=66852 RepID=UPI00388DD283
MKDEVLKVYAYVITSSYREKAVKSLAKYDMIPTEIAQDSGIKANHISKVLRELKDKDIVVCTNEQDTKYRNYQLTSLGREIAKNLK